MDESVNPLFPVGYDIAWSTIVVLVVALAVVALVSLARTASRLTSMEALIWTLVTIFVPLVGPVAWLSIGRRSALAGVH
jgi:Phospholipase_D-nuclease N-terminal